MYEFVRTATGWRVFWGVDPLAMKPETKRAGREDEAPEEPDVLLLPSGPEESEGPKAA